MQIARVSTSCPLTTWKYRITAVGTIDPQVAKALSATVAQLAQTQAE